MAVLLWWEAGNISEIIRKYIHEEYSKIYSVCYNIRRMKKISIRIILMSLRGMYEKWYN